MSWFHVFAEEEENVDSDDMPAVFVEDAAGEGGGSGDNTHGDVDDNAAGEGVGDGASDGHGAVAADERRRDDEAPPRGRRGRCYLTRVTAARFIDSCVHDGCGPQDKRVDKYFSQYDRDRDERLSGTDFLELYTDACLQAKDARWAHPSPRRVPVSSFLSSSRFLFFLAVPFSVPTPAPFGGRWRDYRHDALPPVRRTECISSVSPPRETTTTTTA